MLPYFDSAVCNLCCIYAREAQAFQAGGLVDLWGLAHKIASTLETTPLNQIEPMERLDVQMKDQFHCNSSTDSWQVFSASISSSFKHRLQYSKFLVQKM